MRLHNSICVQIRRGGGGGGDDNIKDGREAPRYNATYGAQARAFLLLGDIILRKRHRSAFAATSLFKRQTAAAGRRKKTECTAFHDVGSFSESRRYRSRRMARVHQPLHYHVDSSACFYTEVKGGQFPQSPPHRIQYCVPY